MATQADIETIARTYLRDFPKFFQTSFDVVGRTYELDHINIDSESLWVAVYTSNSGAASVLASSQYNVDERNGILRLTGTYSSSTKVMVEGYYYEWVTPTDLAFYSKRALDKHLHTLHLPVEQLSDVVIDAIGISAICESLWSLMTEYSRDIDVITSESVHIPASQRFRMVQSLLSQWEAESDLNLRFTISIASIIIFVSFMSRPFHQFKCPTWPSLGQINWACSTIPSNTLSHSH